MTARHRLAGLVLAIVALAVVAGASASMVGVGPAPIRISAEFESTVGLYPGSDVRVLGVRVGTVTELEPAVDAVVVHMEVDADVAVAGSTHAALVAPTLVSDRYVQLTEPWTAGARLKDGDRLPLERTAVPLEIDALYNSVNDMARMMGPEGANKDGALSELISVGAANLDGNGEAIRTLLRDFGAASRTFADSSDDLFASVENFNDIDKVLEQNDEHVRGLADNMASLTSSVADDRDTLVEALQLLGPALAEVEEFIEDNRKHIRSSVGELSRSTATLAEREEALDALLAAVPIAVSNVMEAYDAGENRFTGRGLPLDVLAGGPAVGVGPAPAPDMRVPPSARPSVDPRIPLMIPAEDEGGGR